MRFLRTPDEGFRDLPGWPFAPRYADVPSGDGALLRMHFVDEGPREAPVVLLLHGEPSWAYLYRKMIPVLLGAGLRAVAPDLVGFGRSDKPAERSDYTYQRHVDWMRAFVRGLGLRSVTLFAQDWGGLIGLRLVAEDPDRFARVVAANTFLPTGDEPLGAAFDAWRRFSQEVPVFPTGRILQGATTTELPPEVVAAYDAPFPDESYKAGARQFPTLVPARPDDPAAEPNRRAWAVLASSASRSPSSRPSATPIRSRAAASASSRRGFPARADASTRRSRAPATSCRKTAERSWESSSRSSRRAERAVTRFFHIVDVFAEKAHAGNPLAVVRDAAELATEAMQDLAREFGFSETTFILSDPRDVARGVRVRIFTPAEELPFAGHPTLGTAWVLREHPTIQGAGHFLQEDRGEELGKLVAEFASS